MLTSLKNRKAPSGVWDFLQLFYPRLCEGCSQSLLREEQVLCVGCTAELPLTNYHHLPENETTQRLAGRLTFEYASSLAYFTAEGLLQHLLHQLKYHDKQDVGVYLGQQLGHGLLQTEWAKTIDVIVPVPLHPKKEAIRGYNQSVSIAEGLSEVLGKPIDKATLYRLRHTESQTQKSRAERIANMQDIFGVRNTGGLQNKHVLLIDDVLTTGATLEACALVLQSIPGLKVSFASIGIAMD